MAGRDPATFIAPGFRFHPTDEELVKFYPKRKLCGKPFPIDAIADADVYKFDPWDLPGRSALKSRDREWYFFSGLDKKYGHGSKTNRATERGYWKTTGKDRNIFNNSVVVGYKKTLVYYIGRAPKGERTDWVMHEYRLAETELEKAGVAQASFVLCRIFQKSGHGPKNGEQHGAPFVEEEWEDEEEVVVTGGKVEDEPQFADGAYLETDDLEQLIDFSVLPENNHPQMNYYHGDTSNQNLDTRKVSEDGPKPLIGSHENFNDWKPPVHEQQMVDEHKPYEVEGKLPIMKSYGKADKDASEDSVYLLDEPYFDGNFDDLLNEGLYLEADDLLNSIEEEEESASFDMLHEYLGNVNANDEIFLLPNSSLVAQETQLPQEPQIDQKVSEEHKMVTATPLANAPGNNSVSLSNQNYSKFGSDLRNPNGKLADPIVKHSNRMLESIHAPPAFAADFPTKEAALRLALATQLQNTVNFTASTTHSRNPSAANNSLSWFFDKNGKVQLMFSLSVAQGGRHMMSAECLDGNSPRKNRTAAPSRMWLSLILFWVCLMFISMRIGTCVYAK